VVHCVPLLHARLRLRRTPRRHAARADDVEGLVVDVDAPVSDTGAGDTGYNRDRPVGDGSAPERRSAPVQRGCEETAEMQASCTTAPLAATMTSMHLPGAREAELQAWKSGRSAHRRHLLMPDTCHEPTQCSNLRLQRRRSRQAPQRPPITVSTARKLRSAASVCRPRRRAARPAPQTIWPAPA
jgi:hypothetical protein